MGFERLISMIYHKTVPLGISINDSGFSQNLNIHVSKNQSMANLNQDNQITYSKVSEPLDIKVEGIPWKLVKDHYVLSGSGIVVISNKDYEFKVNFTAEDHLLKKINNVTAIPTNQALASNLKNELNKFIGCPVSQVKDQLQTIIKLVERSLKRQDEDSTNIVKNQSSELNERLINPLALYNPNSEKVKPENTIKRVQTKMSLSDTSLETASDNSDDLSDAEKGGGGVRFRSPKRAHSPESEHQIKSQKDAKLIESSGTTSNTKLFYLTPFMFITIFFMFYNFPTSTNFEVTE